MTDKPERIWTDGQDYWAKPTHKDDKTEYVRADLVERYSRENERLREALKIISAPQYGLQELIEDGASEEEFTRYWMRLASSFASTARIALLYKEK